MAGFLAYSLRVAVIVTMFITGFGRAYVSAYDTETDISGEETVSYAELDEEASRAMDLSIKKLRRRVYQSQVLLEKLKKKLLNLENEKKKLLDEIDRLKKMPAPAVVKQPERVPQKAEAKKETVTKETYSRGSIFSRLYSRDKAPASKEPVAVPEETAKAPSSVAAGSPNFAARKSSAGQEPATDGSKTESEKELQRIFQEEQRKKERQLKEEDPRAKLLEKELKRKNALAEKQRKAQEKLEAAGRKTKAVAVEQKAVASPGEQAQAVKGEMRKAPVKAEVKGILAEPAPLATRAPEPAVPAIVVEPAVPASRAVSPAAVAPVASAQAVSAQASAAERSSQFDEDIARAQRYRQMALYVNKDMRQEQQYAVSAQGYVPQYEPAYVQGTEAQLPARVVQRMRDPYSAQEVAEEGERIRSQSARRSSRGRSDKARQQKAASDALDKIDAWVEENLW